MQEKPDLAGNEEEKLKGAAGEEKRLSEANAPAEKALRYHPLCRGKIEVIPKCFVRDLSDFAIWYTPGVAAACLEIARDPEKVYEYTNKWNMIAVVSDGTRVLGLGNIGPQAAMPVMEGKGLLFKYLGGVDAVPICLASDDPDQIIETVKNLEPSFGGINLEDIEQPKCFRVLDTLRAEMNIPVWHDDQQGTASVILAGLINALKIVGKRLDKVRIGLIGAGAATVCTVRLLVAAGADPANMILADREGTLHAGRNDLVETHPEQWQLCLDTNPEDIQGHIPEVMEGADVVIALSAPGPGVIKPEWVKRMADDDAIIFACANPVPEIWPWEAKEAGARIVATGRSDFPNQVNNSLGFPGIFRGALDVRAKGITDEMCIAAASELARFAEEKGMDEEHILPTMDDWDVFVREAVAVGTKAVELELARLPLSPEEIEEKARGMIDRARRAAKAYAEAGLVPQPED